MWAYWKAGWSALASVWAGKKVRLASVWAGMWVRLAPVWAGKMVQLGWQWKELRERGSDGDNNDKKWGGRWERL